MTFPALSTLPMVSPIFDPGRGKGPKKTENWDRFRQKRGCSQGRPRKIDKLEPKTTSEKVKNDPKMDPSRFNQPLIRAVRGPFGGRGPGHTGAGGARLMAWGLTSECSFPYSV